MSKEMVGFRFDSLHGCFSNLALMSGSNQLGSLEQPKSADDYFDYLTDLSNNETPFIVVTPQDIGGRLTVPMLHALIEMYNPGFVGIDQISLMDDARSREGTQERIRLTNIAEDLYLATEKYKIPIIAPVQASKVSEKENKDEQGNVDAPKLEHAFGADGIVQNATRVIAIKKQGKTMKMVLRKNRYGLRDGEVLVLWDIDKGVVQPMLSVQKNEQGAVTGTKRAPAAKGVDLF
jgi:hypothetical protein